MRKVAIVGAGAIGSTLAALLDRAREQVYLIGREEQVRAIKKGRGLLMDGIKGEVKAKIQALETLDFKPDMVLLTVKTQDVVPTLEAIKPYIEHVPVMTMQNGIRCDELASGVIGQEYLMSAVLRITSTYLEPGKVTYVEQGGLVIGQPYPACKVDPKIFLNMLTKIMPTTVNSNIYGAHWSKFIFNLNNAIPALTGTPMGEILTDPALFKISLSLMKEGIQVAQAIDVTLEPLPDTPVGSLKLLPYMPAGIAQKLISKGFQKAQKALKGQPFYGSTLQSIKRGKPTEIDYLNGEIVRLGGEKGVPVTNNEKIVEMIHEVEESGQFFTLDEVLQRLQL